MAFILMQIPNLFYTLAINVIRFKTHTQVDNFVLFWNTSYHLANIFVSIVSIVSVGDATTFLLNCPTDFLTYLANSIIGQAPYFMNLIILATGQETMLQLLQWRSIIKHAFFRPLINLNYKSRRYHDWLNSPPVFEEAFIFGFFAPILVYGLMIAVIVSTLTPFIPLFFSLPIPMCLLHISLVCVIYLLSLDAPRQVRIHGPYIARGMCSFLLDSRQSSHT